MGVYNPLAEMPISCTACYFRYSCPLSSQNANGLSSFKHPNCPLVEVKEPHGDLIDRDGLTAEVLWTYDYEFPTATGAFDEFATRIVPNIINNAHIIIEAEEKDDEETLAMARDALEGGKDGRKA